MAKPVISLEDAYRLALSRSEAIMVAEEVLIQSEAEEKRMKSFLFPKITADVDYFQRSSPVTRRFGGSPNPITLRPKSETQFNLILSQPLYSGGRARAAYRSSQLGTKQRDLELTQTREDLLFEVARAYYEALKGKNNVKIGEEEVVRLLAHRRNAARRLEVGEETKTVLLRAEAELSDARAKLIRARNAHTIAKDRLSLLARIHGDFELVDPPVLRLSDHSEAEWTRMAHEGRIELTRGGIAIDRASEEINSARGNFLPSLSLELEYRWNNQAPEGDFLVDQDRIAIVKLRMPIFEGMLRMAELRQARSRYLQSVLLRQQMKDEIEVSVRRAILDLSSLTGELIHLEDRLRFAKEAFSLASKQFTVGLGTHIDVLDANSVLRNAERQLSNTRYDREIAILRLKKEAGSLSPQSE